MDLWSEYTLLCYLKIINIQKMLNKYLIRELSTKVVNKVDNVIKSWVDKGGKTVKKFVKKIAIFPATWYN